MPGEQTAQAETLGPTSGIIADLGKRDGLIAAPVTMISTNLNDPPAKQLETSRMPMRLINDRHPRGIPLPILSLEEIDAISIRNIGNVTSPSLITLSITTPGAGLRNGRCDAAPDLSDWFRWWQRNHRNSLTAGWSQLKQVVPTRNGWVFLGWGVQRE